MKSDLNAHLECKDHQLQNQKTVMAYQMSMLHIQPVTQSHQYQLIQYICHWSVTHPHNTTCILYVLRPLTGVLYL